MKLSWNLVFHALALIVQYGNLASGYVPTKFQMWIALVVGAAQSLVAWRAHYYNPDGTPAAAPYTK